MSNEPVHLDFTSKIGILDPEGIEPNPLTGEPYSSSYKSLAKMWENLPAYAKAQEILESIRDNQLTFIISGTGSGKSVLIPKFALHYTNYKGKIGMTLPKRVITVTAATFSARTLDVELGKDIGYVFKGSDRSMNRPENKIVYMTDGILTMKMIHDPNLTEYSVIIIDEAHERKVQIDMIMLFLKNLLQSGKRPDLRVIIMSATIDGAKYQNYFAGVKSNIVMVSGKPNYPIEVHFLEKETKNYIQSGLEIIESIVNKKIKKDILFFITKSKEAIDVCNYIRPKFPHVYCIEVYADMDKKLQIFAEDKDKYMELGNYDQKLVMATNVAESSLTIDGLKYVVDSGYELFSYFDPDAGAHILETRLIAKSSALQRRGRVGRTESGICYHLLTEVEFNGLKPFQEPDILRQDITIDLIKIIGGTPSKSYIDGFDVFTQLMDIPKQNYISYSYQLLKLYKILNEKDILETKLSSEILNFSSLELNQSLFLIFSYQLFCAKEASIILAMIDVCDQRIMNLFYKSDTICESGCAKGSSKEYLKKISSKKGDHLTLLNIFTDYKNTADQVAWAKKYGIKLYILKSAKDKSNEYYRKIINISKAPQLAGAKDVDPEKKIIEALKRSHLHLTAKNLKSTYAKVTKQSAQIAKDSVLHQFYDRSDLSKKMFVYNELKSISGNWEFSVITLI